MMNKKLLGAALSLTGLGVVLWQGGWILAAGLLVAMWGNNLERSTD
jgi:hypothetical protein